MSKKYKPGNYIVSLDDLMEHEFVYCAGKLIHTGWFSSWQLRYAKAELSRLRIREAVNVEKIETEEMEDTHDPDMDT